MKNNEEKYPLDDMAKAWIDDAVNCGMLVRIDGGLRLHSDIHPGSSGSGTYKTEKEWIKYYKSDVMNESDEENEELYQEYLINS